MTSAVPDYIVGIAGGLGGAVGAVFTNPLEVSPKYSVHHQFSCTWNCGNSRMPRQTLDMYFYSRYDF